MERVCRHVGEEVGRPLGRCCSSPGEAGGGAWIREVAAGMEKVCVWGGRFSMYFEKSQQTCHSLGHTKGDIKADLRVLA